MAQQRQTSTRLLLSLAGAAVVIGVYDLSGGAFAENNAAPTADGLPDVLAFTAVVRDFKAYNESGGHPDFEIFSNSDANVGLVQDTLDADAKPVFKDSYGYAGIDKFRDASNRRINPALYDSSFGDRKSGELTKSTSKQLTSAEAFRKWFRDDPTVNISKTIPISLRRVGSTNTYVFDSAIDEPYKSKGGFFPIDNDLFGNYKSTGHNFAFTTEVTCKFVFNRSDNAVFTFTGDDDLWVFIDGKLVMDLGGLHAKREQVLEVNRLTWLNDKQIYTLKIFHAERHTTQSNFRMETSLQLVPAELPSSTGLYD